MAVALKHQLFTNARDLAAFCVDAGNNVTTVISIVKDDTSGGFVLFYI